MPRKVKVRGLKTPAYGPRRGKMVPLDIRITREIPAEAVSGSVGSPVRTSPSISSAASIYKNKHPVGGRATDGAVFGDWLAVLDLGQHFFMDEERCASTTDLTLQHAGRHRGAHCNTQREKASGYN